MLSLAKAHVLLHPDLNQTFCFKLPHWMAADAGFKPLSVPKVPDTVLLCLRDR